MKALSCRGNEGVPSSPRWQQRAEHRHSPSCQALPGVFPLGTDPTAQQVPEKLEQRGWAWTETPHKLTRGGKGCGENMDCEGQGLETPRWRPELGAGGPRWPVAHHFHVLPCEVLDFFLHPLDALQQILILLVHSLVLLHKGLQLDLGLPGAFQLWIERHRRPLALRPIKVLRSQYGG